jgi:2-oxoisovalerate dehydrogenase E1 component beta subunit
MAKVTMVEAVNLAHAWEMAHDPAVVVIGEDVGVNGGVFRATAGLQAKFGKDRVQDTPLAEGMIGGMSVGMATHGLKPIAEIQFMGFIYPAMDQIANHMARMRNRTRGRLTCPIVLRMPHGGGIHAPEHHSESLEAMLAHHAGLRVVCPSSPARAYGLLLAAIRDPDPVIFLEPVRLYRLVKQEVPDDGQAMPLDVCFRLREGGDVTIVTWGAMTFETLRATDQLQKDGVSCEVLDLATVSPIDHDTILESVTKTGRLVILHEAPRNCGEGAEIAAHVE